MNNSYLSQKVKDFQIKDFRFAFGIFICLLLFSHIIRAQYRFDSWTTDNGLLQASVNSILQTRDGNFD